MAIAILTTFVIFNDCAIAILNAIAIAWLPSFILEYAKAKCIEPPHYCRSTKANFTVGEFYVMEMVGIQDNLMRQKILREFFATSCIQKIIFKAPTFFGQPPFD